jgi:hypothetical protein
VTSLGSSAAHPLDLKLRRLLEFLAPKCIPRVWTNLERRQLTKLRTSIALAAGCAAGLGVVTLSHAASAEQQEECPNTEILGNSPIYFPYPSGLMPPDLCSEVKRVQREVDVIFKEALAEWRALPPPTLNGQPPILQGTGYQAVEILGKLLNYDRNMWVGGDVACSSCGTVNLAAADWTESAMG